MRFLLILLLASISIIAYAKPFKIDKLCKIYDQQETDILLISSYLEIADKQFITNLDSSLYYYKLAMYIAESDLNLDEKNTINSRFSVNELKAYSLYKIGLVLYNKRDFDQSISYYKEVLKMCKTYNFTELLASTYYNLANVYTAINDIDKGLEYFNESIFYFKKIDYKGKVALVHKNKGMIYYSLKKYEEALKEFELALKERKTCLDEYERSILYNNIGHIYFNLGNKDSAEYYYEKALTFNRSLKGNKQECDICKKGNEAIIKRDSNEKEFEFLSESLILAKAFNDSSTIAQNLQNIGEIYIEKDSLNLARTYITKSLEIGYKISNKECILKSLNALSEISLKLNDYRASIEHSKDALQVGIDSLYIEKKKLYGNLYKSYLALNDYENTLKYLRLYDYNKDSILAQKKDNSINEILIKYEATKKQQECDLLQKQNKIKALHLSKSRHIIFVIFGVIALILMVFILIIVHIQSKNKIKALELEQKLYRVQINPEFIHKTLAIVKDKIINSTSIDASSFIADFARLMRQILENSQECFITLDEEIETIKNYFTIQNNLTGKHISYKFLLDEQIDTNEWDIPPMLLQPFLSKVIINEAHHGNNEINISTLFEDQFVKLCVEFKSSQRNNLRKNDDVIALINERLEKINRIYKEKIALEFKEYKYNGSMAIKELSVKLPAYRNV